jgi:lambda repressor-like predicted transcriptional regulator
MYVTILPDEIWADRYNQFNGEGVAQKVIAALRKIKGIPE